MKGYWNKDIEKPQILYLLGDYIEGKGPNCTFILDENEKGPQIFLALWPPPMVDAMEQILGNLDIRVGRIRSEKFTGC